MTISWDHPGGPGIVFVLALAYRHIVGYVLTDAGLQPTYATSEWTSITETAWRSLVIDLPANRDETALIQVCARSPEGRYDEECPL